MKNFKFLLILITFLHCSCGKKNKPTHPYSYSYDVRMIVPDSLLPAHRNYVASLCNSFGHQGLDGKKIAPQYTIQEAYETSLKMYGIATPGILVQRLSTNADVDFIPYYNFNDSQKIMYSIIDKPFN